MVSLHCPLTPENKGMIDRHRLGTMKASAFLLNTSRGPLVVDQDLADALNAGVIAGAALDVLSVEPPAESNPLLSARNCIVTPHIAWATKEARVRLLGIAVENIRAFLVGQPSNSLLGGGVFFFFLVFFFLFVFFFVLVLLFFLVFVVFFFFLFFFLFFFFFFLLLFFFFFFFLFFFFYFFFFFFF